MSKTLSVSEKSEARLAAVKALYSGKFHEDKHHIDRLVLDMLQYYHEQEEGVGPISLDEKFFSKLTKGVIEEQETLDTIINNHLDKDWNMTRIDQVILALLRAGTFELIHYPNIPFKVIINEYIDIAKQFFDDKEVGFTNGILDNIAKTIRDHG